MSHTSFLFSLFYVSSFQSSCIYLIVELVYRALADTDADGKMDINEFSIACKLINLKLRGFEIPKGLPPSLLASLKTLSPPAIPPLPNAAAKNIGAPPPRPEPPKVAPIINSQPLIHNQPLLTNQSLLTQAPSMQPLLPGLGTTTGISTGEHTT